MSARFGRNQRRKLRAEIDDLHRTLVRENVKAAKQVADRDAAIDHLRTGADWQVAGPNDMALTSLVEAITTYSVSEGIDRRGRLEKKATLNLYLSTEQLDRLIDRRWGNDSNGYTMSPRHPTFEWRGGLWWLDEVNVSRDVSRTFTAPEVEVVLIAVPTKKPAKDLWLIGSDVETMVEARTIAGPRFMRSGNRPIVMVR